MTDKKSLEQIHEHWRVPPDENNAVYRYAEVSPARSEALVQVLERYVPKQGRILEVGCNAGRNLYYLAQAGFKKLAAIEISEAAIEQMAQSFPIVRATTDIRIGPVEEIIPTFTAREFEAMFTMAVLVHIHPESDWVMEDIAPRAKRYLVIIQDEKIVSTRHFNPNYKKVFEPYGFRQVEEIWPIPGLPKGYRCRVFKRTLTSRLLGLVC
jgi:SAM-dependent methyltransferase